MKHLKTLALMAIAASAFMAFAGAGSASGTELICGTGLCAVGAAFHAESAGKAVLDAPFGDVECNSTVAGNVTKPGSSSSTAEVEITELNWSNCGNDHVTMLNPGLLVIHTTDERANGDGTVTSAGAEVTVEHVGTHCIFGTNTGITLGWLTGTNRTGATEIVDISAPILRVGGRSGAFCGSTAPWTGSYSVTSPMSGEVH